MKIARVAATPLHVPVTLDAAGIEIKTSLSVCLAEVHADDGRVGYGLTAITEEEVVAAIINDVVADNLKDEDPLAHERIWEKLYWLLSPRGQTGYASHAIAAIDIALWDLKGKVFGRPVFALLGAARSKVPVYTTFGFGAYDRAELAAAAKWWVARGHKRLKMVVGQHGLQRRDEPRPLEDVIAEDARRVRAVRDAVGAEVDLHVDANCSLDSFHATRLARSLEELGLSLFLRRASQGERYPVAPVSQVCHLDSIGRRPERGPRVAVPGSDDFESDRYRPAQRRHRRRLHAVPAHRRHGLGVQPADRQRRRVGAPQHALARGPGQRRAGRVSLCRGESLRGDLRPAAGAAGRLAVAPRKTRIGVRADSGTRERAEEEPDVTG